MSEQEPEKEYDIYRDSLLRYCGYANEVGEAFRAQTAHMTYKGFNGPVSLTYAIATAYCAADALDKGTVTVQLLLHKYFSFYYQFSREEDWQSNWSCGCIRMADCCFCSYPRIHNSSDLSLFWQGYPNSFTKNTKRTKVCERSSI